MSDLVQKEKMYNRWIVVLSMAIPVAVALLFRLRIPNVERLGFLPPIYAGINALTAVLLITAVIQIKKGNKSLHQKLMQTCIFLSVIFLVLYVIYHATSDSTTFGDTNLDGVLSDAENTAIGSLKYIYYFILISHILLSIGVIPFVLITYVRAALGKFELHRKIARITFPLWLYVAVTGVIVYFMIFPYYPV